MGTPITTKLIKLARRLYPTGRALNFPSGSVLEKLHTAINLTFNQVWLDATGILNTILPDNDSFSAEDATKWERRLGLNSDSSIDLADRKAAILRKFNHPTDKLEREHYLFIQYQLQLAGFRVWVYENRKDDGSGGYVAIQLNQFIAFHYNVHFSGTFQHGQQPHGNFNMYEKIVNHLSNAEDAAVDVVNGRQTFFIGGDQPGKYANIKTTREKEFRKIVLQLKPVESAALLAIRYGDGLFDDQTVLSGFTSYAFGAKIRMIGQRLYYPTTTRVKVWDIVSDAQVVAEELGSANGSVNGFDFDLPNSKIYIVDNSGAEQVRVYDISSKAAIPAENFGSGDLVDPSAISIYKGEGFVLDTDDDDIHVFNLSTGALDRSFVSGLDGVRDIQVYEDRVFVVNNGADSDLRGLHVYDLEGNENLSQFIALPIASAWSLFIENGYLYLCNYLGNELQVYNVLNGNLEAVPSLYKSGIAGVQQVAVSDDNLLIYTTGSGNLLYTRNT